LRNFLVGGCSQDLSKEVSSQVEISCELSWAHITPILDYLR